MTNAEFIKVLEAKKYSYKVEGDRIIILKRYYKRLVKLPVRTLPPYVTFEHCVEMELPDLEEFPEGDADIVFAHSGCLYIPKIKKLNNTVIFKNDGRLYAPRLETIPEGYTFSGPGMIELGVTKLPENVTFKNQHHVVLDKLKRLPASTKFLNDGSIYLGSLEKLPKNYKFKDDEWCIEAPKIPSLADRSKF